MGGGHIPQALAAASGTWAVAHSLDHAVEAAHTDPAAAASHMVPVVALVAACHSAPAAAYHILAGEEPHSLVVAPHSLVAVSPNMILVAVSPKLEAAGNAERLRVPAAVAAAAVPSAQPAEAQVGAAPALAAGR